MEWILVIWLVLEGEVIQSVSPFEDFGDCHRSLKVARMATVPHLAVCVPGTVEQMLDEEERR